MFNENPGHNCRYQWEKRNDILCMIQMCKKYQRVFNLDHIETYDVTTSCDHIRE
jgi:hypothetical protein